MSPAPNFKVVNAQDNPQGENTETVGSANLKDVLQEQGVIRGSFFINGTEFRDFEAYSPGEVVRKLNSKLVGIKASLDDEYRLVLEHDGTDEIAIASGHAQDKARAKQAQSSPPVGGGGQFTPAEVQQMRAAFRPGQQRSGAKDDEPEDPIELLGLKATGEPAAAYGSALSPDWQPGQSAEDRKKARQEREKDPKGQALQKGHPSIMGGRDAADDQRIALEQGHTGGGTTTLNQGPSDVMSRDPHKPDGGVGGTPQHDTGGMPPAPPTGPKPGTTPQTTEKPSL